MTVVLASASPRRVAMVRSLWPDAEALPADVDETPLPAESPWETAERLARSKAEAIRQARPEALVIAGDTVVALHTTDGDLQLAKPEDADDAKRMLRLLSDREHRVISGLAVASPGGIRSCYATTTVRFRRLDNAEIEAYVATGEPLDKAGAYAIQGGASRFAEWTLGSLTNVIGLPMEALQQMVAGTFRV